MGSIFNYFHAVANSFKMALRLNYDITVTNQGYNLSQSVTKSIKIIHDQKKHLKMLI